MKTNKNQCTVKYNKERDEYQLLISTDGGETWNFSVGAACVRSDEAGTREPEYIHFSFINEIKQAVAYGFEFIS